MPRANYLAIPAYAVAALLVLIPLLDTVLMVLPLNVGEVAWRFGAAGMLSRAVMTPLLGWLIAYAVASLADHALFTRIMSVVSGVAVLLIGVLMLMFVLDIVQMRARVQPNAKTAFDVASLVALAKYGLGLLTLAAFAVNGWLGTRDAVAARKQRKVSRGSAEELVFQKARA